MENKFIQIIKNKWLRSVVLTLLLVAIIICCYLAVIYFTEKANFGDIDMTKDKIYSISQETKDKIGNIEKDITLSVYNMPEYVLDFAYKYENLNSHIKVEKVEDLLSKAKWKTDYGITDSDQIIVISEGDKEKVLSSYDLYTYDYTANTSIDITEEAITNGILDITTTEKPKIYFLTGHNLYSDSLFEYIKEAITGEANEVAELNIMVSGKMPDDCNTLVITSLKEDIKELEKNVLVDYIKKGGKILLLLDPNLNNVKLSNFQKVLDEYGVAVSDGLILEGDSNQMMLGAPNFVITKINSNSSITKNINMDINACLVNCGKLTIASSEELEKKNVTSEVLATVSSKAFYRTDLSSSSLARIKSDEDASGDTVAAIMTKKIDDNTSSKLVVFTNTVFATNTQVPVSTQSYMYPLDFSNNKDVLLNSISYLTEREGTITIRKNVEEVNYDVTELQNRIVLGVIFAIPIFIIIVGIVIWIMRRRKQ